jgi:hypothetical protein
MKYKRKTLRRRSRARKQRGGAIGDIAKHFEFLMRPHPDGEIADFTMPEELVELIKSEPLLSEDDYDRMGLADMSCLSADGYGLSKEYIESYSSRTSPLHIIGNIARIEDMRICSKQYFETLMNKILPFYNPSVDYISVEYIDKLQQILKINKTLEEGHIYYKEFHADLKRLLPYIPFNTIK